MNDSSISVELALSVAKYFGIYEGEAERYIDEIRTTVRDNWERLADKSGFSRSACEYMRPAFEICY